MIPVILCLAILIFSLMHFVPGDPARQLLGIEATDEEIAAKRAELGLDKPYIVQLGKYLSDMFLHFDLGTSYMTKTSIAKEIGPRLGRTLVMGTLGTLFGMITGTLLGISAAVHVNRWQDSLCIMIALVGVSMPSFWLALMLLLLFVVKLRWFPAIGLTGWKSWILPILATGLSGMASFARQVRSSMLEVIRSDYVITAKAKGLSKREVIYGHALPNALIPILTVFGGHFAMIFAGSIVIETIFGIPGMGLYMVTGINNRDYPVVQSCVVMLSFAFCVILILVDLAYAVIDPRIKARYARGKKSK